MVFLPSGQTSLSFLEAPLWGGGGGLAGNPPPHFCLPKLQAWATATASLPYVAGENFLKPATRIQQHPKVLSVTLKIVINIS